RRRKFDQAIEELLEQPDPTRSTKRTGHRDPSLEHRLELVFRRRNPTFGAPPEASTTPGPRALEGEVQEYDRVSSRDFDLHLPAKALGKFRSNEIDPEKEKSPPEFVGGHHDPRLRAPRGRRMPAARRGPQRLGSVRAESKLRNARLRRHMFKL